jgi:predicted nucleic acid-binding protein
VRYLVDANVLSEVTKPSPEPNVVNWLERSQSDLVVDPVILGELRFGILLLAPGRKRRQLERWFESGVRRLRCLTWEATTGLRWARLLADLRGAGLAMPLKDSLIAAAALEHGLAIVTRNQRHFEPAGVETLNPFEG